MDVQSQEASLRAYIDVRIKQFTEYFQKFTTQYEENNQRYDHHSNKSKIIRSQIENLLKIFTQMLKVKPHLRQQINNVKSMSNEQISEKKTQLQKLLALYNKYVPQQQHIQPNHLSAKSQRQFEANESMKELTDIQPLTKQQNQENGNKLGCFLLFYQGVSYALALIAIFVFLYNLVIK